MSRVIDAGVLPLLGRGRIHPALHIDDRGVVLGRVSEGGDYELVTSDRAIIEPAAAKDVLLLTPRPYWDLAGRWADEDFAAWRATGDAPLVSEVLATAMHALDTAMEFPRPGQRELVATWAVASYFYLCFLSFPRLSFSGERESGKSKAETCLRGMAWNALLMLNPTPAVMFRLVQEFRPTILLDEVEGLSKEDARDVLAIVNSGYKAGGTVPRCEGKEQKRVELFAVYSPLALAAIRSLNATTEDRCIPLVLQRGTDRKRLNLEVNLTAPLFRQIRDGCYRLLLTRWREVAEAYQTVPLPTWLNARARELWKPLLTIAHVADQENGLALTSSLLALARDHVDERSGVSAEAEALLAILGERATPAVAATVRPGDLREPLRERLGWREPPSAELVANWLRRLGFRRARRDRVSSVYEITAMAIAEVVTRYGLGEEGQS